MRGEISAQDSAHLQSVAEAFELPAPVARIESLGNGNVNATYRVHLVGPEQRSTVLQRLNRSREAVEHYQAALRLNPAEGRWWVGLGIALEGAGQAFCSPSCA